MGKIMRTSRWSVVSTLLTTVLVTVLSMAVSTGMSTLPASAHPHVFIKVRTLLLVEGGALVGLHHIWVLDEGWRRSLLDENDRDGDGQLSATELATAEAESKSTLEAFKSFTTIRHGTNRIRPGAPQDLKIETFGDQLGMSFKVPLAKPIPLVGAELLLEVYDATYFSSYEFAGADAVTLAGAAIEGCTITIGAASPQQLVAFKMIARQLGPEFAAKALTPQAVAISCGKVEPTGGSDAVGLHRPVVAR